MRRNIVTLHKLLLSETGSPAIAAVRSTTIMRSRFVCIRGGGLIRNRAGAFVFPLDQGPSASPALGGGGERGHGYSAADVLNDDGEAPAERPEFFTMLFACSN